MADYGNGPISLADKSRGRYAPNSRSGSNERDGSHSRDRQNASSLSLSQDQGGVSESLGKFFKAQPFLQMTKTKQDQAKLSREIKY